MIEGSARQRRARRRIGLERRRRLLQRLEPRPQRVDHQPASSRAASGA